MNDPRPLPHRSAAVIGGGPAGLMAAEVLAAAGAAVDVYDAMPSVARKFLLAGKGGMNITHAEPPERFLARYGERRAEIAPLLAAFGPDDLRDWIHGLGIATFVGSSGRVFPTDMKAAPLLRAWLHRLRAAGVRFHPRHRWLGWDANGALRFATPAGELTRAADATVLALGGGSWARLGSDGAWLPLLAAQGIAVAPLRPANCGFDVGGWSAHFAERFAGAPVKTVAALQPDGSRRAGEFVVTASGVEGSLVYALSAMLRDAIERDGEATLTLDLLPDWREERLAAEIARPRGARSLASHLQSRIGLKGVKAGLLREVLGRDAFNTPPRLAAAIKALPLRLTAPRPLDEAISSAGGVRFEELDAQLMLRRRPGVFCAGEMLDWEAPTGGYLLTACFASGRAAGAGALAWLRGAPATPAAGA
ncbi:TIGR03862 family flavoprotein [Azospira restricta]|uniref:TIGR03862 family flavoprotein n=1 Tax=Azospira restricta TaxID=404405 RepID=A0A974SN19_9RHOO|nr:TIGR03862 family flavoprotein [Azospira restricta]QRJ63551.1 TIGR03862 family flavoprotein [Azospira restricta]